MFQSVVLATEAGHITHPLVHAYFTVGDVKHVTHAVFVIYAPNLQGRHINQMSGFEERESGKETQKV